MPTLTTQTAVHVCESLSNFINMISPEQTPFTTSIGTSKATARQTEWLKDALAPADKDNAAVEGAVAPDSTLTTPDRLVNQCQIFTRTGAVSGTLRASDTAGTKDELARQIAKAGKQIKLDIEAAILSANPSALLPARKLAGAEAWIKTAAFHGTGGSTPGYSGGSVGAVVAGTSRPLTEAMFKTMLQKVWDNSDGAKKVIVPGGLKARISSDFNGSAAKQQMASTKTVYGTTDIYESDFGALDIVPSRHMSTTTVIAYNPELWNLATFRAFEKLAIAKLGDADRFQLVTEVSLESLNEVGNGKLADVS